MLEIIAQLEILRAMLRDRGDEYTAHVLDALIGKLRELNAKQKTPSH